MTHRVSPGSIRTRFGGLMLALPLLLAASPSGAQKFAPAQGPQPEATTATLAVTTTGGAVVEVTVASDGDISSATHQAPPAAGGEVVSLILQTSTQYNGLGVPAENLRSRGDNVVVSRFRTNEGLEVRLRQELRPTVGGPGTAQLEQIFQMRNPTAETVRMVVLRYADSDLGPGGPGEYGLIAPRSTWSYLMSTLTPTRSVPTRFVGLQIEGGSDSARLTVKDCCSESYIRRADDRTVAGDGDGDGGSDLANDLAQQAQVILTLAPGESQRFALRTLLGVDRLDSLAPLPR